MPRVLPRFRFRDGTLTDNFEGIARSIRHALAALAVQEPDDSDLRSCVGPPLRATFARLLATDDTALVERAIVHYRSRYARVGWQENSVYAGIESMLAALAERGEVLYLCTSKPLPYAEKIVAHFDLLRYLAGVHGTDLAGTLDDKAILVRDIVTRRGLDPGACVIIGDRKHDVRAAQANGLKAIGVLWGYGPRDELVDADALVASPEALAPALDALRARSESPAQRSVWL